VLAPTGRPEAPDLSVLGTCARAAAHSPAASTLLRVILHQPERPERPNAERPYRNPIGRRGLGGDAWPMEFQYGRSAFGCSGRSGWCRMTLTLTLPQIPEDTNADCHL